MFPYLNLAHVQINSAVLGALWKVSMEDLNGLLKTKGGLNAKLGTKYELWRKACCTCMLI